MFTHALPSQGRRKQFLEWCGQRETKFQLGVWAAVSIPAAPGQNPVGGSGGEASENSANFTL